MKRLIRIKKAIMDPTITFLASILVYTNPAMSDPDINPTYTIDPIKPY